MPTNYGVNSAVTGNSGSRQNLEPLSTLVSAVQYSCAKGQPADHRSGGDRVNLVIREVKRVAIIAAMGGLIGWIVHSRGSTRTLEVNPVIGGDTWPPVPVNPARRP